MSATQASRQTYIDQACNAARQIIQAVDDLAELRRRWDRGMSLWIVDASGSDPSAEGYAPGDFDAKRGLMKADVAALFVTLTDIDTLLATGHGTNLEKVR